MSLLASKQSFELLANGGAGVTSSIGGEFAALHDASNCVIQLSREFC